MNEVRELASHINIIIATLMVLWALFLVFRRDTGKPANTNSAILNYSIPFLAIFLFIISVFAAWYSGTSNQVSIGGILPVNDAFGYYNCAHTLLDEWQIGSMCQRRPIYAFYLATLVGLAGRDLQIALLLQTVLLGSVVYLYAKQLAQVLGVAAALPAFALLFLFASDYSMTTMTENAGLLFAALGFIFIWTGTEKKNTVLIAFGTFLVTLGLNARAGAFFVLPLIAVWAAFFLGLKDRKRLTMVSGIIIAIVAGFIFNSGLNKTIDAKQSSSHANFSYSLYGVTAGGESWTHVFKAEPQIFSEGGTEAEKARKIYAASVDNIINQPELFIKGYCRGFLHYLEKVLHFVRTTRHEVSPLRITLVLFWFSGLIFCISGLRRDPHLALIACMAIGVILSGPLITWGGGNRVYAATLPVDAALVAIGFAALQQTVRNRRISRILLQNTKQLKVSGCAIFLSILGIFLILPGPLLMRQAVALSYIDSDECDNDLISFVLRPGLESASLRITATERDATLFPVQVTVGDYRKRLVNRWVPLEWELVKLPENTTLLWGYQRSDDSFGKTTRMIWPESSPIRKGTVIHVCARKNAYEKMPGFARVETAEIIAD